MNRFLKLLETPVKSCTSGPLDRSPKSLDLPIPRPWIGMFACSQIAVSLYLPMRNALIVASTPISSIDWRNASRSIPSLGSVVGLLNIKQINT